MDERMKRLSGKTAIVTGAGSGIGRAIAALFAVEGAQVVAVDRDPNGLAATRHQIEDAGCTAMTLEVDIAEAEQVRSMVDQTLQAHQRLDVLVNNAGLDQPVVPVAQMDIALWDRIMSVNVRGTFLCSRFVLPVMIEAGGGVIVNVASDLGYVVIPGLGAYCSSKGAVLQLTRVLAAENGPLNIRVNALCPTMIDTPMARRTLDTHPDGAKWLSEIEEGIPLRRIGTPQDVANAALFLASDDAAYINGVCLPVDGGRTVL
ncbi:MAG: SDR family oxidoreductase [Chloroflexi bacterium]|nr:MAG: SDR family oxidoreductase [Chloroflexota bacterium]